MFRHILTLVNNIYLWLEKDKFNSFKGLFNHQETDLFLGQHLQPRNLTKTWGLETRGVPGTLQRFRKVVSHPGDQGLDPGHMPEKSLVCLHRLP